MRPIFEYVDVLPVHFQSDALLWEHVVQDSAAAHAVAVHVIAAENGDLREGERALNAEAGLPFGVAYLCIIDDSVGIFFFGEEERHVCLRI